MRAAILLLAAAVAHGAVTVAETPSQVRASSGCLSLTFELQGRNAGRASSLKFHDAELLGNGGSIYTAVVDSVATAWHVGSGLMTHSVRRGADFADVAMIHRPDDAIPVEFEQHYVLRADECGFHVYSVYRFIGSAAHPSDSIAQLNTTIRADPGIFNYHSSDFYWTRIMPLPQHLTGRGDLQDATYTLPPDDPYYTPDRTNYTKYDFSSFEKNHVLHGIYGGGYGIWCVHTPLSKETWNGGPTKQNLTVHQTATTPVLLNEYFNAHYSQGSAVLKVSPGWTKTYGPWFFYVNRGSDYQAMWADAARYAGPLHRTFYDALRMPGYLPTAQRATVRGRVQLSTGDSMAGATAVLSDSGLPFDRSLDGYQYWTDLAADGSFVLHDVRPGKYRLSAYRNGVFDDYHRDDVAIAAGAAALGNQVWIPASTGGTTVLQIGMPDRTAMEFKDGDRFKHYGLFHDLARFFPDGVRYVFGETSDREGWFFTQWRGYSGEFRASFPLRHAPAPDSTGSLTVALASALNAGALTFSLNGNPPQVWQVTAAASSATRSGAAGTYSSTVLKFPGSQFRAGTNVLSFRMQATSVQYDAIRLAIEPPDLTLAPQPDLTISNRSTGRSSWNLVVSNVGRDTSLGPVTVSFTVPWPLTAAPLQLKGEGWTCGATGHVVVDGLAYDCTRADALAPGSKFTSIEASTSVVLNALADLFTTAVVAGGGDINTVNNIAVSAAHP